MFDKLGSSLDANAQALRLRSERQKLLAANIANADTPGYKAQDFDFGKSFSAALRGTREAPVPAGPAAQLARSGPSNLPTLALASAGLASGASAGATPAGSNAASVGATEAGAAASAVTPVTLAATGRLARTDAGHLPGTLAKASADGPAVRYRTVGQPSVDGNTVDSDTEQARFADNTLRYEASLRFLNGQIKTLTSAINGQAT
ncbi:flagellar basal body protein [Derxia gummosa]|uniref:Flagellar basal body protein n=1 Tax=Derxia gummosa DSM 723 TaxID=1121388 RepID=A0A8B6X6Q5_9BURK|nr:flagellar basal body protein [Derxia gummosa]